MHSELKSDHYGNISDSSTPYLVDTSGGPSVGGGGGCQEEESAGTAERTPLNTL